MKRFMLAIAATCILSVSALAGEMPTLGVVTPTPNPVIASTPEPGDIQGPEVWSTVAKPHLDRADQ